jgi:protein-tyrosine phosphatase
VGGGLTPDFYWISELGQVRLAIMARPRGGEWLEDEIAGWKSAGIDRVVSLLEADEATELGLVAEGSICEAFGIEFTQFPIPDRGLPASHSQVQSLARSLASELRAGRSIAIHCRAGIGRSSLMAGCVMHLLSVPHQEILPMIARARGLAVPDTHQQIEWLAGFVREDQPL